ncbi:hypothetical protein [uncultured Umboniibacter sp.]|uniref:hypothetical protein n=1 Tax=uncultured Umboniibacter sp. TaxID=1798917 RepID=UPI002616BD67|nr:hypothetical protein [uncultured Umboniibacter sp.]
MSVKVKQGLPVWLVVYVNLLFGFLIVPLAFAIWHTVKIKRRSVTISDKQIVLREGGKDTSVIERGDLTFADIYQHYIHRVTGTGDLMFNDKHGNVIGVSSALLNDELVGVLREMAPASTINKLAVST